jgi:AcrR family transcriptional regulator
VASGHPAAPDGPPTRHARRARRRPADANAPEAAAAPRARLHRRTQDERTREARGKLLQATIDVLVQRGYAGLTTKDVAARAGFSSGALVHHYGTKADLVIAATDAVYADATRHGEEIARGALAARDPLAGFVEDCLAVYFGRPFFPALEVLVLARTEPTLMAQIEPIMRRYREETNRRWLAAFARQGLARAEAEEVLTLTLNLVRGMAVNSLWQTDRRAARAGMRDWMKLARTRWPALTRRPKPAADA